VHGGLGDCFGNDGRLRELNTKAEVD